MLLNYYGCTVTAEEFASYYLPTGDAPHTDENGELIGCDPWEAVPRRPIFGNRLGMLLHRLTAP